MSTTPRLPGGASRRDVRPRAAALAVVVVVVLVALAVVRPWEDAYLVVASKGGAPVGRPSPRRSAELPDLAILYEHPEWFRPLFGVLKVATDGRVHRSS